MRKWLTVSFLALASLQLQALETAPCACLQDCPKLVLYYSPSCPHSQQVLNYLASIKKTIPMKNVYSSQQVKDELIALGGKAQVPCLLIDGKPLYHSDEIVQWLSEHKDLY